MKRSSLVVKSLSICSVIIFFSNIVGYALEPSSSNIDTSCGEWKVDSLGTENDQRIETELQQQAIENDCNATFILTNRTGIYTGNFLTGGSYTLQLRAVNNNAKSEFDSFLIPGLENQVQTTPDDFNNNALVNIQGQISWDTYTIDLSIFAIKAFLEIIKTPCIIPTDQIILAVIPEAPLFVKTAKYLRNRDFVGSQKEFQRALKLFYEKIGVTLSAPPEELGFELGVECGIDIAKEITGKPVVMTKIVLEYAAWVPNFIFDLFKYKATSASVKLIYTPSALTIPSSENWIAFLNQTDLWLIHSDGSDLTQVTKNDSDDPPISNFKWSPDGGILAYSQSSNIYLYDIQTSKTTILETGGAGGFDWSFNGKQIMFDTPIIPGDIPSEWSNKGLWVTNIENGNKRQLVKPLGYGHSAIEPQWSSNGSYVIFSISPPPAFEPGNFDPSGTKYGVVDLNTETITDLLENQVIDDCKWAPSELKIACIKTNNILDKESQEVVVLDKDGKVLKEFTKSNEDWMLVTLIWSIDGEALALGYESNSTEQKTELLTLENGSFNDFALGIPSDWSSDGKWILTVESGLNVSPLISVVDLETGESVLLSEGTQAIWQP